MKIFRDLTAQRATVQALRESEARFRAMADHAPVMVWVTDENGRCVYLNRHWYDFTGQSEAEALGAGWLDAVHPDDRAKSAEAFFAATAKREPFRIEYRLRRAEGVYRWAIDTGSPRLGAALGLLFAPKPGSELRHQLYDSSERIRRRATEVAS